MREHLEALARNPLVVGVRRLLQGNPDALPAQPSFVAGVHQLAMLGVTHAGDERFIVDQRLAAPPCAVRLRFRLVVVVIRTKLTDCQTGAP